MENLIKKISKILEERNYRDIKIEDETDVVRVFERLIAANINLSAANIKLEKQNEKIFEKLEKIEFDLKVTKRDVRDICTGKTQSHEELAKLARIANNGNGVGFLHRKVEKVYRGLRNEFGDASFNEDIHSRT